MYTFLDNFGYHNVGDTMFSNTSGESLVLVLEVRRLTHKARSYSIQFRNRDSVRCLTKWIGERLSSTSNCVGTSAS
jgi:hypothetical protein